MEKELIECQRCLEMKAPAAFYLKSAKDDPHVRREKICKACKKGQQGRAKSSRMSSKSTPSFELTGLDSVVSVFLRLKQWRDEHEAVVKESNRDSFDSNPIKPEKEIWRSYA